jgi:1-acyl-sn-glycerol-3-phosphate acyltransferase
LLFTGFLFLIFPVVVVVSFLPGYKGGHIIYKLCKLWSRCLMPLWGIRFSVEYEQPHDTGRPYVFVFNHISYMDIPTLMRAIRSQPFRILARSDLSSIPIFGYLYRHAVVAVDRSNAENRTRSMKELRRVLTDKISVVIAPEGTFNTTGKPLKSFYDGAFRIAIETQTPIKPLLFLDNHSRMHYDSVLSLSPGPCRAIYMEEIPVAGYSLDDIPRLRQRVFEAMEQRLIYYGADWIAARTSPPAI